MILCHFLVALDAIKNAPAAKSGSTIQPAIDRTQIRVLAINAIARPNNITLVARGEREAMIKTQPAMVGPSNPEAATMAWPIRPRSPELSANPDPFAKMTNRSNSAPSAAAKRPCAISCHQVDSSVNGMSANVPKAVCHATIVKTAKAMIYVCSRLTAEPLAPSAYGSPH